MSRHNVELFCKALAGYNRRDVETMLEIWHPEAEWYPFTAQVEGDDAYHGHDGLRRWWANVDATFDELEASAEDVRDLGDTVLALGHLRARFKIGVAPNTEIGWLTRYRDGLAVWGRAFQSHAEALEAAELEE
ncbi:MAG TPA: nuclear transport factor 2 family protein [Solirubrobacterales bacterium]|nr:nuclear transport factor 2 family protein [Solirubrobacterales bacterium]